MDAVTPSSPIVSYAELITREEQSLQHGMNFRLGDRVSVFLMSTRPGAPYKDAWVSDSDLLIYEGHDVDVREAKRGKKNIDQPLFEKSGKLSRNGKFFQAAHDYRLGRRKPLRVQVYEKLQDGIWFDKGLFELMDATYSKDGKRNVFKFHLRPAPEQPRHYLDSEYRHERMIPSAVKVEVWKRDKGRCVKCGAKDGLHYDHIIPFSKGGRSDDARNIQLLCARHNLEKKDRIE